MKQAYLVFLTLILSIAAKGQNATEYVLTTSTSPYTSIAGGPGTVPSTAISQDDNGVQNIPIGFNFIFCGTTYTQCSANSNGWLSLANSTTTNGTNAYSNSETSLGNNAGGVGFLMPFWDDLNGSGSTIYYQTTGTAPNRIFTFQWGDPTSPWGTYGGSDNATFQVKLYESSGVVQYAYSAGYTLSSGTIGLSNSASDISTLDDETSTAPSAGFSSNAENSPTANTLLTWTPPPTIFVSPSSLTFTTLFSATSAPQNITITGYGFTSGNVTITTGGDFKGYNGTSYVATPFNVSTLTAATGSYMNATVPIEFIAPATVGTYSINATVASTAATTKTVLLTGNSVNPCTGTPTAGTASISPASGNPTTAFTLSLSGFTVAGGITFQWESSPNNSTWTAITGATNSTYHFTGISANTYYRCEVTCDAGPTTVPSNSIMAPFVPVPMCVGTSSSWEYGTSDAYDGVIELSVSGYSGSDLNDPDIYSAADAYGYADRTSLTPIDLQQSGVYAASGTWGNTNAYQEMQVWIDFDNDGTFSPSEEVTPVAGFNTSSTPNPTNFNITIPLTASPGTHLMRMRAIWQSYWSPVPSVHLDPCLESYLSSSNPNYYDGDIADYLVNIVALPACTGTPTAGTVTATTISGCGTSFNTTLSTTGASTGLGGLNYQWQLSPDNVTPYTDISGATNDTYTATVTAAIYYKRIIGCTPSGLNATSSGQQITINPYPNPISGTPMVCMGSTSTLTETTSGGTWTSGNTAIATIGSGSGVVSGIAAGTATITFTLPSGCTSTVTERVVSLPSATIITPGTAATICMNGSSTFTAGSTSSETISILSQDFNSGFGSWIVDNTGATNFNAEAPWQLHPDGYVSPESSTYHSPDNSQFVSTNADYNGSGVTVASKLTSPVFSLANTAAASVSFQQFYQSYSGDATIAVEISTDGGTSWNTLQDYLGSGTGSTNNFQDATVSMDAYAGQPSVMLRWNYVSTYGYYWAVDNIVITATPAVSFAWTGISGATGLSCTNCNNPTITPVTTGTNVYSVTGTALGCSNATTGVTVSVNPLPAAIAGPAAVCTGSTITLTNATGSGTWTSGSANATIDAGGVITGVTAGTANITYTITATGCIRTTTITVNQSPAAIGGATAMCNGLTTTLTNATPSGIWTTSAAGIATVNGIGVVTGVSVGNATISYITFNGCAATQDVAVNIQPAAIAGTTTVCTDATTVLTNTTGGGAWTSTTPNATVAAGTVSGVTAGTSTLSYTIASCAATTVVTVNQTPSAIGGTATVCEGAMTTLNNSYAGGIWTSGSANATIGAATGIVTGVTAGNADITYTLSGGCMATKAATINPMPGAITGTATVCVNANTTLANTISGGAWTSSATGIASATGNVVTGVTPGNATITYTLPEGCLTTQAVTVNALPTVFTVTGGGGNCAGASGVHIGLSGSAAGTDYQLYNGTTATGTAAGGSYSAIDYGLFTADGIYTVRATTTATGCSADMSGSATVTTNLPPVAYNVTGTGTTCEGTGGVAVGMDVTDPGINYQLYNGATAIGGSVTGTGADVTFGNMTTSGTYTVRATDNVSTCVNDMAGSAVVTINALPLAYNVTGGGNVCGGAGLPVGVDNSETGVDYNLYMGATLVAGAVSGTSGTAISFGNQTINGTYTVTATNAATGCIKNMNGSAIVTFYPAPVVQTVSGGGTYCEGTSGVHVTLDNSETGISYQLYNGTTATNAPQAGNTGVAIDFPVTASGTYTILATNVTTACHSDMTGAPVVVINALPLAQTVSGGGNYCAGDNGLAIGLDNSETGINYTLYMGSTAMGTVNGTTGTAVSFGPQTAAGIYSVMATSTASCSNSMTGIAAIGINPTPLIYFVTGGGNVCAGGNGVSVGLSASNTGVDYQLYNGATALATVSGNGLLIDYGPQTAAGTYSVHATDATTGCTSDMTGTANVIVNTPPAAHTVSGSGSYCEGATGLHVTIDMADNGVTYQLYNGTTATGAAIAGSGTSLDFGELTAGVYSVQAIDNITGCKNDMTGIATISMNAGPVVSSVTGGGAYCAGGAGVHIGIPSEADVDYTLYLGASAVATVTGTGTVPVDFGLITAAGVYTVHAANSTTACGRDMTGSATVTVNTQPTVYTMTGGGAYCAGSNGRDVSLSGSDAGITYQLYLGTTAQGAPVVSTGGTLSFGLQTGAGTYSVQANPTSTCTTDMSGTAVVTINTLPTVAALTGGGAYCDGGTGVHIGLVSSVSGVTYQLYNGSVASGSASSSTTGGAIDFGLRTGAGTYTVMATNAATTCNSNGSGSIAVSITPTVTPTVTVASAAGTTVCEGQVTSFSATATNGGTTPAYLWRVNGATAGVDSMGFTYVPANGDVVTARLTSSATCATPDSATAAVMMTVVNNATPMVSITNDKGNEVCVGTTVLFTAAPTFAGTIPTYRWMKNGSNVSNSLTYSYIPTDGDVLYFIENSSMACVTSPDAYSNNIVMTVDEPYIPVVNITAYPGNVINEGQSDTLVAYVTNAGATPAYQWKINSVSIAGATNATYITSSFNNNDSVSCAVTGSGVCGLTSFNSVIIHTSAVGVTAANTGIADISLLPNPNKADFTIKGKLGTLTNEDVDIELTDMLGQVVYKNTIQAKNGGINEHIVLGSTLANGMYMLSLRSGNEHKVFHMVMEQ